MTAKTIKAAEVAIITQDLVERRIHFTRGCKVMLDSDLAGLYGVNTFRLNEAVKRNRTRFPEDFMFQLTATENESLISQIAISKKGRGGRRHLPYVFTEQGVAMLSSVLNSDRAVQVNIAIMRAFVNMRKLVATSEKISKKLGALEKRLGNHDKDLKNVFAVLRQMMAPDRQPKQIGYIQKKKQ